MHTLAQLGHGLRASRKKLFPKDNLDDFSLRIGVGRATLQKMEKGDLTVSMAKYFQAAEILGLTHNFEQLLTSEDSLFDD